MFKGLMDSIRNETYNHSNRLLHFEELTPPPVEKIDMDAISEAEINDLKVEPAKLMRMAITEYLHIYKSYQRYGYPDNMAEKLALKYMFKKLK